ncbi:MAG: hypothetical protein WC297_03550 [Candidatus Paceibacterota bacterium]|jgi:hypothetical protein
MKKKRKEFQIIILKCFSFYLKKRISLKIPDFAERIMEGIKTLERIKKNRQKIQ